MKCKNLIILRYSEEHVDLWSVNTFAGVTMGGHLECLKYLTAKKYPWNYQVCTEDILNA